MKAITAGIFILITSLILAILLILKLIISTTGAILFVIALLISGLLSRGFTRK
jgi:hypothetical protein